MQGWDILKIQEPVRFHLLKDSNDNSSVRLWEGKLKPKNVE